MKWCIFSPLLSGFVLIFINTIRASEGSNSHGIMAFESQRMNSVRRKTREASEMQEDSLNSPNSKSFSIRTENNPLLDFPSSEIDNSPLLDFPDPVEKDFKERSLTHNASCRMEQGKMKKSKATRAAIRRHKPRTAHEVKTQNRILEKLMLYHFVSTEPIPDHHPLFSWEIMNQTLAIFESFCKRKTHLPPNFISNAAYAFKKLHYITSAERTEYLTETRFKWISATLTKCLEAGKGYRFYLDDCKETVRRS